MGASAIRTGRLIGENVADGRPRAARWTNVIDRYRKEGLQVKLKEPADHVAVELEYMSLLAQWQMQAMTAGDESTAIAYLEKQHDFLETHLGVWLPMFTQRIVENARTGFYRHVSSATDVWVNRDRDVCARRVMTSVREAADQGAIGTSPY